MKLLYVQDATWPWSKGGAEKRLFEIAKRMAAKGHEVHVLGAFPKHAGARRIEGIKSDYGVYYHVASEYDQTLFAGERRSVLASMKFAWGVFKHLLKNKYDVIECFQSPLMHIPVAWLLKGKAKLIVSWFEVWNLNG